MRTLKTWFAAAGLIAAAGVSHASPVFQGRLADGTASDTCSVSGVGKCTSFYFSTLDITILNDWNLGTAYWSATAGAFSAQALAESAGFAATNLAGWVLPTGNGFQSAGDMNQYLAIWDAVGGTLLGLETQFDSVQAGLYWSGSGLGNVFGWIFDTRFGSQGFGDIVFPLLFVAVRPGDVAAPVPEPQTLALALLALGAAAAVRGRRPV
jgi:MYXO-CTERM domain-containing protein